MSHLEHSEPGRENVTAWIVCSAVLAAWAVAAVAYGPGTQARADRAYLRQSEAEHAQACINLGDPLGSPQFAACVAELVKLQARHEQIAQQRDAAALPL